MSATNPAAETLRLLASMDASLKAILLVLSEKRNDAPAAAVASDADLDGTHGDPEVRAKDPRDWTGPAMKGRRFSECPPDYLDLLAQRFDYFAGQEADPKKAGYNRADARRARGWALRIRNGTHVQTTPASGNGSGLTSTWAGEDDRDVGF